MRITRDILLKIVKDTVNQRTRADRNILAIYLNGSLLEEEYLSGGTTDIDLFMIHTDTIPTRREIVYLSDDIHLDIAHHLHRDYRNTRQLRVHPWLGPTIKDCRIQYDPQHFLDFTQASVRGQYEQPDHVLERSRNRVENARQVWSTLHDTHLEPGPRDIMTYLGALENAANAIASLNGAPITERRFLVRLPQRFDAIGRLGLYQGLLGLLGATNVDAETLGSWIPIWQAAYQALPPEICPARIHPLRQEYYRKSIEAQINSGHPYTGLWPLLRSWTLAVSLLAADGEHFAGWSASLEKLDLTGKAFSGRVAGLDAYLDTVEETLEQWAISNGASLE